MNQKRHLRIFLSSPGDVARERALAQQVIEQELPKDPLLRDKVTCEVVRWDDPNAPVAMPATLTPQEAVNRGLAKPSQCDAVIVILWSRMGTPLPAEIKKPDGTAYLSGTEWEYEDAISAKPLPHTLVYWRKTKPDVDIFDREKRNQQLEQIDRVNDFFARFRNPDGSLKGGYTEYETPEEFHDRLLHDLKEWVKSIPPIPRRDKIPPPPYGAIGKALRQGAVIPFIGPGASSSGRPPNAIWDPTAPAFLPSGIELSHLLADEAAFPATDERDDLAEVSSYYATFQTRRALHERLRQLLCTDLLPNFLIPPLYRFLAEISTPLLIITTNFDTEIEQSFRAADRPYDLVVYPAHRKDLANAVLWWPHGAVEPNTPEPSDLDIDLTKTSVIFKMYGSFSEQEDWNGFVITEEDYVNFFSRLSSKKAIPKQFSTYFRDRSLLFLGYRLRDWALRVVISSLSRSFARRAAEDNEEIVSWAIGDELTELEDRLWRKWGVVPYQVGIDEFVEKLRVRMAL